MTGCVLYASGTYGGGLSGMSTYGNSVSWYMLVNF